jgi:large subunit ribosomal protein L9
MKTKIILEQDIPNLGVAGDVKDVAPGYARNYLFPRFLAVPCNARSEKKWAARKEQVEKERGEKLAQAQDRAKQIQDLVIGVSMRAGQDGKLYGSVTTGDIAKSLAEKGFVVDRRWIELRDPIRATGEFQGAVRLHPQVRATFKIQVQAVA